MSGDPVSAVKSIATDRQMLLSEVACIHVCMYVYVCVCVYIYMYIYVCVYIYIYIYIYI